MIVVLKKQANETQIRAMVSALAPQRLVRYAATAEARMSLPVVPDPELPIVVGCSLLPDAVEVPIHSEQVLRDGTQTVNFEQLGPLMQPIQVLSLMLRAPLIREQGCEEKRREEKGNHLPMKEQAISLDQARQFELMFSTYTGSMTALIETSFDNISLSSLVLEQWSEPVEGCFSDVAVAHGFLPGNTLLYRCALLQDSISGKKYLYATTLIHMAAFPSSIVQQIQERPEEPLGRIIKDLPLEKTVLATWHREDDPFLLQHFSDIGSTLSHGRRVLFRLAGQVTMLLEEIIPCRCHTVCPLLSQRTPTRMGPLLPSLSLNRKASLNPSLYPLGQSQAETQRLQRQGELWCPLTEQLFKQAGMKVLDLGCGAGDVSLLLADLVGTRGKVVGVDRDPHLLEIARKRLADARREQVSFQLQHLPHLTFSEHFDAVVGRAILLYVKKGCLLLQTIKDLLRSGGVVVFQEPDTLLSELIMSHKQAPSLFGQCLTWVRKMFEYTGNDAQISLSLPRLFEEAGFPCPQMQVIGRMGCPHETCIYEWMADLIRSQHDLLVQFGIATREEIALETLAQRLQAEAMSTGAPVVSNLLIGAWARKPACTCDHSR